MLVSDENLGIDYSFSKDALHTLFNGIKYTISDPTLSRFYPLYEMAMGVNTKISGDTLVHRDGYIFKDIK